MHNSRQLLKIGTQREQIKCPNGTHNNSKKNDVLKAHSKLVQKEEAVVLTTTVCTLLRQELSVNENHESACEILRIIQKLAITNQNDLQPGEVDKMIIRKLLEIASKENLLRYSYKPNLIGQPDNPQ